MTRPLCLSACLVLFATPAFADPGDGATQVSDVVVTATRLPARADTTPDLYVIDAKQIELQGLVFADQALATVPGLTVSSTGAFGGVTSVQSRGMSSGKTLVLLDGIPMNDASQPEGGFDFATFDLFDVKRIEVLTGPQSSLWGSDAIGGVISITTREPDGVRAVAEGGSFASARGALSAGFSGDAYALGLSVSGFRTDGIPQASTGAVKDPFSSWTGTLNGRLSLTDQIQVDARLGYNAGRTRIDGYPPPDYSLADTGDLYKTETATASLKIEDKNLLGLDQTLSLLAQGGLREGVCGDSALYCDTPYKYRDDREVLRWTAGLGTATSPWALTFGAERKDEAGRLSDGSTRDLGETSAFVVGRVDPTSRLTTTLSLRWDDPDVYKSVFTGKASAAYALGAGFQILASWGQGFKTPTISELACDFCYPSGPSVGLKPEHAQGYDLGLTWRSSDHRIELAATLYDLDVKDELEYSATYPYRYYNVERVRSKGVESHATLNLQRGFYVRATYTYTDSRDVTEGTAMPRIPKDQGSVVLGWTGARAHAALTVRAEGQTPDIAIDGYTPQTRPGFGVADFSGGLKLTDQIEATLTVRNLTNQHYEEALGYNEPGAWFLAGLRLRY
jgi:vitamin B12 transporter